MSEDSKAGKVMLIFCFGLWSIGVWIAGIFAFHQGVPIIIPIVTTIMGLIPPIFLLGIYLSGKRQQQSAEVRRYSDEPIVYTGDYELHSEPMSQDKEKVYLIPSQCQSCNSTLSTEEIDWVGPLQAKCPHCGATIDAKEKTM